MSRHIQIRKLARARSLIATLGVAFIGAALVATPAQADGPGAGTPWVVSVGDSYISGEAGRWVGSSNSNSAAADALGGHGHDGQHPSSEDGAHAHPVHEPHESPPVVTIPLIALAIPSIAAGWVIGWVLYGGYFGSAIVVAPGHASGPEPKLR